MRVAIVENTRVTHHGQVGVALHEAAALVDIHRPWSGQPLPPTVDADALVVFGGEQSALDDHSHPYLPALADLMASYTAMDRPVLGICLGAQLLARAYGGQNHLGAAPEFGWVDVSLTEAGRADPLLSRLPVTFPIFQWHSDTFTLPDGAVRLARSPTAENQAFRIGRATYGTQFHFEASRSVVRDWSRTFPEITERMRPGWSEAHPVLAATWGVAADQHGLVLA
ncbi:MAG: type 1 glutamine amidotransferase, partial [Acetobacteraceae bacterium]